MTTDLWENGAPAADLERQRPHDLPSELALLGSLMRRPELLDELADTVDPGTGNDPGDYFRLAHALIHRAVDELRETITEGEISHIAVSNHLAAHGQLVRAGGPAYLSQVYDCGIPASADFFADAVAALAERRRFIEAGQRMAAMGWDDSYETGLSLATAQTELDGIVRQENHARPSLLADSLDDAFERAVTPPSKGQGIPTGSIDLDTCLGGLAPGRLIVVGARPSVGKSTLAIGMARAAAIQHGVPTLFVSLEMSRSEVVDRIVSAEATVALHHITSGGATRDDVQRMGNARKRLNAAPLRIDDSSAVSVGHLRQHVRALVRSEGLRLLIVDYLQLMTMPRAENRQVQVATTARQMKLLAREFGIPVVLLSQLNREVNGRADKRPTMSDLRESGAIEQDADQVILLHREDMYERESPRAGEADLIVDKNRHGPRTTITTAAQLHYSRFVDMAKPWTPGGAA